jgi:hypothetical protein
LILVAGSASDLSLGMVGRRVTLRCGSPMFLGSMGQLRRAA